MKNVIRFIILGLSFLGLFVISTFINLIINKIEKIISRGNHNLKIIKVLKCVKNIMVICGVLISILIAVPFNYDGKLQQKYDSIVNQISDYLYTFFNKDDLYEQETEISIENNIIEPLKEFPFRIEYNVIFPETKEIRIPTPEESGTYSMEIPLDLRAEEYQSEKVPVNSDIHGFVVNNLYYCSDDDSITDISRYNFYKFADYWLYLHTIDISFTDYDGFNPDLNGATIVLQEKETQKKIVLQENYLSGQFVQFQCSTGQYIIEVQKGGIAYTCNLNLNKNEKTFLALSQNEYYYLSPNDEDEYIVYKDSLKTKDDDNKGDEGIQDTDIINDNSQIQQYSDDYVIIWEDATFERLMKECLNKEQIVYADVKDILTIEIFDDKIILDKEGEEEKLDLDLIYRKTSNSISLNDLKYFDSLVLLSIFNYQSINCDIFKNEDFASRLSGLYISVKIDSSQIKQISYLNNLQSLFIERNNITTSDLETIAAIDGLIELVLWDDNITDITPLSDLKKLMYLDLADNNITDISILSNLEILETVILVGNNINDYSPVSHVKEVIKAPEEMIKYFNTKRPAE